jgi:hypothetical protein
MEGHRLNGGSIVSIFFEYVYNHKHYSASVFELLTAIILPLLTKMHLFQTCTSAVACLTSTRRIGIRVYPCLCMDITRYNVCNNMRLTFAMSVILGC